MGTNSPFAVPCHHAFSTAAQLAPGDDWPRFRGENGSGVTTALAPTEWSPADGIKWKIALPGPGVSSPVVSGKRALVTCYSGYGVDRQNLGDMNTLQ